MKRALFLLLILISNYCYSQTEKVIQDTTQTEQYCLIMAAARMLSTKVTITIDYGEHTSVFKDNRMKDEEGAVVKFNSVVDALNYMNKRGWIFVDAYPMASGNGSVYNYLMKKKISTN